MTRVIRRAAVIGAGTMGAAIAAHLANAGVPTDLLDVVPSELTPAEEASGLVLDQPAVRNRIVKESWERCLKSRPPALFSAERAAYVRLGNLEDDFQRLAEADWIVEAVVERLDVKKELMARIERVRKPGSIISTNTSGIPIGAITQGRSADFKSHFLGTHFFNPPRYLYLLEIIPHAGTAPEVVESIARFGQRVLGKGVVVCNDTPNFIANRFISIVGTYAVNYALDHGYSVEDVDALTGPVMGRPKTATFRLFDLIGIDVLVHVNANLYPAIPHDPYREELVHAGSRSLFEALVQNKWLGNKAGQGFYKPVDTGAGRQFWVLDPVTMAHRPPESPRFEILERTGDVRDSGQRLRLICAEAWAMPLELRDRAAQFIWANVALGLVYAASMVPGVANDVVSVDNACRWGFNHDLGPFEIWDTLGVAEAAAQMRADGLAVPLWVQEMLASGSSRFYCTENGHRLVYSPAAGRYVSADRDPRAIELVGTKRDRRRVIRGNDSASLVDLGDGTLCLEFHSKANALDGQVSDMLVEAREELEGDWVGMVIGNEGKHFCAGADLNMFVEHAQNGAWGLMDGMIRRLQDALLAFRYSPKPVVSAPFNMVLGGGAEVMMAASAICASAEAYIGQVEAGVGVVPALGGCKEPLRRVLSPLMKRLPDVDPAPALRHLFELIAMAKVSGSAEEARAMGFLTPSDRIVMNPVHLLYEAKHMVLEMSESGYHPPARSNEIWAAGADCLAALEIMVWSYREAGHISEHDALIANKTAYILCGGRLSRPQWVDVQVILDLERESFLSLLGTPKTLDRVLHMLRTGKPLRN